MRGKEFWGWDGQNQSRGSGTMSAPPPPPPKTALPGGSGGSRLGGGHTLGSCRRAPHLPAQLMAGSRWAVPAPSSNTLKTRSFPTPPPPMTEIGAGNSTKHPHRQDCSPPPRPQPPKMGCPVPHGKTPATGVWWGGFSWQRTWSHIMPPPPLNPSVTGYGWAPARPHGTHPALPGGSLAPTASPRAQPYRCLCSPPKPPPSPGVVIVVPHPVPNLFSPHTPPSPPLSQGFAPKG